MCQSCNYRFEVVVLIGRLRFAPIALQNALGFFVIVFVMALKGFDALVKAVDMGLLAVELGLVKEVCHESYPR